MDRRGSGAVAAIVVIAALLVIGSIIYPYAKEWWETRGPGSSEDSGADSGITSIRAIVDNPSQYNNRKVTVIGTLGQATFYYLEDQESILYLDASGNYELLIELVSLQKGPRYKATGIIFYSPQLVDAPFLMLENIWSYP